VDHFPGIRWIVPHLGGLVPMVLDRVDRLWALNKDKVGGDHPPSEGLRRLYYDTANSTEATLRLAVEVLGADRLVFGTDFPYVDRHDLRRPIHDLLAAVPDAARVLAGSAALRVEREGRPEGTRGRGDRSGRGPSGNALNDLS